MTAHAYRRPVWRVTLDGQDITGRIEPRLIQLAITECRSGEADQLDIALSDHDGALDIPSRGVRLRVFLGWDDAGLVDKGTFLVDEVEYSGPPDRITLRARSADMTSALRTRNERSFHGKTIEQITNTIAQAHGLTATVGKMFASVKVAHIDQTNESDLAFLNRIGKRYDAVATIKDGRLLLLPIEHGQTATGRDMPTVTLVRSDGDRLRFHSADRDSYTGVRAYWQDKKGGKRRSVVAGVIGNAKRMRQLFASEKDALDNARAEWKRLQRGTATLEFDMAFGRPDLTPQAKVQLPGAKAPINEIPWLLSRVVHQLDDSGLTTRFEAERLDGTGGSGEQQSGTDGGDDLSTLDEDDAG